MTMGRAGRATVLPLRASLYSGWPPTFTAEYMGGVCMLRPRKRPNTAQSAVSSSPAGTGAVSSTCPVMSPVLVRSPRRSVAS